MYAETARVLIVDDEAFNRKILTNLLSGLAKISLAKNGEQALASAKEQQPSLILLDIVMPDMSGFEVLQELKGNPDTQHIPVIFITGLDSIEDEAYGLKLGACDYIQKPFHMDIVKARVTTHLELTRQRKLLEKLANFDALTSIPNRRHFETALATEWASAQREQSSISIAMLDVDHFKRYNDNYGHPMGDEVLRQVARTIEAKLNRPRDQICRYGGEEFCVILPTTEQDGAKQILTDCMEAIEALNIDHEHSATASHVTVSVGVYSCTPDRDMEVSTALSAADKALYQAKTAGRNQLTVYQD